MTLILVVFAVLGGGVGCDQRLPEDPVERIGEVRRRMDALPYSHQKAPWLVHAADNPTTPARELLLESLEAPHLLLSAAASQLLAVRWVRDPETRRRMAIYYLDPRMSARNRETLWIFAIQPFVADYEDFAALPEKPPLPPGWVHTAPHGHGEDAR